MHLKLASNVAYFTGNWSIESSASAINNRRITVSGFCRQYSVNDLSE